MSNKLKLYIVSILAVRPVTNDKGEPNSLYFHRPWIVEARNLEDAGQQACTEAEKWFPIDRGFTQCDISIDPVPKEYYERLAIFAQLKNMAKEADPKEKGGTVSCYTTMESEDVLVAFDGPVS